MGISAKVICDSISKAGHRLTTMEVTMHRFILSEFNTHRNFSRNSASSRAIPIKKRIEACLTDPAYPLSWGSNKPGMQAGEELDPSAVNSAKSIWTRHLADSVIAVKNLDNFGLHKQVANRLLEPFLWHTAIVSATEWENFFTQRCSPLAQPEIRVLAEAMEAAYKASEPRQLYSGEYHLPYISLDDVAEADMIAPKSRQELLIQVSIAHCARVSYLTHDGKRSIDEDLALYKRLIDAKPPHASPFEHVATPCSDMALILGGRTSNFEGWQQYREQLGMSWLRR